MAEINGITRRIIGCAIDVHRALGPGHCEHTCASALDIVVQENGLRFRWEPSVPARFRDRIIGTLRPDFIVEDSVDESRAQIMGHLRATGKKAGLLINFRTRPLKRGIRRFIL